MQWIPLHRNIKGNEIADLAAKIAHITNPITVTQDSRKINKRHKTKNQRKMGIKFTNTRN